MTYASRENSVDSGQPDELYLWSLGSTSWRYTSSDTEQTYLGQEFQPKAISRSAIASTAEIEKSSLTVTAPRNLPLADLFISSVPSGVVSLTVFRDHSGEGDWQAYWKGRITNATLQGDTIEFTHESVFTSLGRPGLRRKYQLGCPHVLYGVQCGVIRGDYKVTYTVDTVSGTTLAVPAASVHTDGYFSGGFVEYEDPATGGISRRSVKSSAADGTIVLSSFPFGLAPGASLDLFPGCDHTLPTCVSKFNNLDGYGGMPYIPKGENPFDGTKVL